MNAKIGRNARESSRIELEKWCTRWIDLGSCREQEKMLRKDNRTKTTSRFVHVQGEWDGKGEN